MGGCGIKDTRGEMQVDGWGCNQYGYFSYSIEGCTTFSFEEMTGGGWAKRPAGPGISEWRRRTRTTPESLHA
eukprot:756428-Hanusia_phi.AAC.1